MKTSLGLWLDHRKAVIVAVSGKGETTKLVISKVEKQLGRTGGRRSLTHYESRLVPADDRRQRKLTGQLNIYYQAVIAAVRGADYILIFGPGEAAGELRKRLKRTPLRGRILGVEIVDRMTDPQIVARARRFFEENRRRQD
jgi:hypothetical protein